MPVFFIFESSDNTENKLLFKIKTIIMKKWIVMVSVILISQLALAQKGKSSDQRSVISFNIGPSLPMGDFGSKDISNDDAGAAKTGIALNLNYTYQLSKQFGLTGSLFYNTSPVDNGIIEDVIDPDDLPIGIDLSDFKIHNWKWYGLIAGPQFSPRLSDNVGLNLRLMGGIANAASTSISYQGQTVVDEDMAATFIWQAGAGLHFGLGKNMFLFTNIDYQNLKPEFTVTTDDGTGQEVSQTGKQKMCVLNLTAGFGIRF